MKATPFQDSFSPDVSPSTSTRFQPANDQEFGYITPPSIGNIPTNKDLFELPCEINPTLIRKVMAEALGTFLLMFCIGGIIGNMAFMGIKAGLMEYAVTAALTVIVLVFSIGSISGAHLNPAVTIAFATVGPFPWSEASLYVLAQVGGSVLAAYTVPLVYGIEAEIMMTRPLHGCTAALWVEFVAAFILLFLTTSLFNDPKSLGNLSGFVAGITIGLGVLITGPVSGGSMNPARSLGPALISWRFDHLWVYLLAPTLGAIVGVSVYRILRLQGWSCESEICTTPLQEWKRWRQEEESKRACTFCDRENMLGVFSSSIMSPPEGLVAAGSRTPSLKVTVEKLVARFVEANPSMVSIRKYKWGKAWLNLYGSTPVTRDPLKD